MHRCRFFKLGLRRRGPTCFPNSIGQELPAQLPDAVVVRNASSEIHYDFTCTIFNLLVDLESKELVGFHVLALSQEDLTVTCSLQAFCWSVERILDEYRLMLPYATVHRSVVAEWGAGSHAQCKYTTTIRSIHYYSMLVLR